jgi:methionine biosynthesis protein MetW
VRDQIYKLKGFFKNLFNYPHLVIDDFSYDKYWIHKGKGDLNSFQLFRAMWIEKRIEAKSHVLDVGAGDGSILMYLLDKKKIVPNAIDFSDRILDLLKEKNISVNKIDFTDNEAIKQIPRADYFLILEVLEHMPKPEDFLRTILTQAKKSVFISIPNTGYIGHRLRLLFGSFPLQWKAHPSEHLRFWTVRDFKWWIKSLGFFDYTQFECYEGVPLFNKIWPSLFGKGIIAEIKCKQGSI